MNWYSVTETVERGEITGLHSVAHPHQPIRAANIDQATSLALAAFDGHRMGTTVFTTVPSRKRWARSTTPIADGTLTVEYMTDEHDPELQNMAGVVRKRTQSHALDELEALAQAAEQFCVDGVDGLGALLHAALEYAEAAHRVREGL